MFVYSKNEIIEELSGKDKTYIREIEGLYVKVLEGAKMGLDTDEKRRFLIDTYNTIGHRLQEFLSTKSKIHVYGFAQPIQNHGPVSRVVAKLRHAQTESSEFIYYTQRAFEFLFSFAFGETIKTQKNYFFIPTPLTKPVQNYAVHKLPNLDVELHNTTMCVLLRGALLPSLIIAKEIQEYSSIGYVPDFALFRISREEKKDSLSFVLDEKQSYMNLDALQGKDIIIADPMNATAGSILTILQFLKHHKVEPRSIKLFHVITSLKGALQVFQFKGNIDLYTLWMDPALNEDSYILPGLGDAGDRLNGIDKKEQRRNLIQLIANYGNNILQLYRAQIQKIEERILGQM